MQTPTIVELRRKLEPTSRDTFADGAPLWPDRSPRRERRTAGTAAAALQRRELAALVVAAAEGDDFAWSALIARLRPTVESVLRPYRLDDTSRDEVAQRTWVRLFRSIERIATPDALHGWVATTARREALRYIDWSRREVPADLDRLPDAVDHVDLDARIAARQRRDALHRALGAVAPRQRALTLMLIAEPTPSYEQISETLGIPIGSIGPTRARCIARLRRDPELAQTLRAAG